MNELWEEAEEILDELENLIQETIRISEAGGRTFFIGSRLDKKAISSAIFL